MSEFSKYLEVLERAEINGVLPNFWCSEDYFIYSGMSFEEKNGVYFIRDSNGELLLPPLDSSSYVPVFTGEYFWSDFTCVSKVNPILSRPEFLDYEFLYDPSKFLHMEGADFAVFRKNSRKWPKRNPGSTYAQESIGLFEAVELFDSWNVGNTVEDAETIINFVLFSKNVWALRDIDGKLKGINVFDWNHKYVNFRYCICPPEPFLSEYMRLLFYTVTKPDKIVNDGGSLGRQSLYEFKKKLNPIEIRSVYSWKIK